MTRLRCRHTGLELYVERYDRESGLVYVTRRGDVPGCPMRMQSLKLLGYEPTKDTRHEQALVPKQ